MVLTVVKIHKFGPTLHKNFVILVTKNYDFMININKEKYKLKGDKNKIVNVY